MKFSRAFVTGASSGLGKALCRKLATQPISLLITGRDLNRLEELQRELATFAEISIHAADLADKNQRQALIERLKQFAPDLVINNAGFGIYGDTLSTSIEQQLNLFSVNAEAVLEISLEAARTMVDKKIHGTILNISSSAAYFVFPALNVYAAAKAFVNQFSQALDIELKSKGVRVLVSCPGQIATPFSTKAAKGHTQKANSQAMSVDRAVKAIFFQLEKQKRLYIFDWRYRIGVWFGKLLPVRWLGLCLRKVIQARLLTDT
jgi:hypothetical protein